MNASPPTDGIAGDPRVSVELGADGVRTVHLSKCGRDPDAKIYSAKDVEVLIGIALLTATKQSPEPAAEPGTPEAAVALEECRLQFEGWANEKGMTLDCSFFSSAANWYTDPDTHLAYEIWMASRAACPALTKVAK